jgi:hemoglobin
MKKFGLVLIAIALASLGCGNGGGKAGSGGGTTAAKKGDDARNLYERMGGMEAIQAVVADFVANLAADDRINNFFVETDIARFKELLVEQICQATGGPCTYSGRDMRTVHTGMQISEEQWNATVEDLVAALDKHGVAEREKTELLNALSGMKPDIVGV